MRKRTEDLTFDEMAFVFGVLMDRSEQERLYLPENESEAWALDYVYDSGLRILLEKTYEVKMLENELKMKDVEIEEKPTKI